MFFFDLWKNGILNRRWTHININETLQDIQSVRMEKLMAVIYQDYDIENKQHFVG